MASTLTVICNTCKIEFQKQSSEVRRSNKLGRRHYCSLRCCGLQNAPTLENSRKALEAAKGLGGQKINELSPFRWHLCQMRKHAKQRKGERSVLDITLKDLQSQWNKQKGICPYTGWDLIQMNDARKKSQLKLTPNRASVDRIDSSKGYTPENIQFVAFIAQVAKHGFDSDVLFNFCEAVVLNKNSNEILNTNNLML